MKRILILVFCLALLLCSCDNANTADIKETAVDTFVFESSESDAAEFDGEIRAMWLSQFDITLMCVSDGEQRNEDEYRARVSLLVSHLVYMKINTAFVQMRPKGDSMYPSDIFPASAYAVGALDGKFKYDPISILIEELKRAEISPHAWINPLRLMSESELSRLNKKYIISEWYRDRYDFISVVDGVAYLDPYYEDTRALVADGVCEIIEKYGVDGIHIDDYFYPTASASFDAVSYEKYLKSGGSLLLSDFRRENINLLVEQLYTVSKRAGLKFGVSPSGNMKRNYEELFADTEEWCKKGIVDYLCPQIYFGFEHEGLPFEKTAKSFIDTCRENGIDMIVGLTLEKAYNGTLLSVDKYAGDGAYEWIENKDILARCVRVSRKLGANGVAFFSYRLFFLPDNGAQVKETEKEVISLISELWG